LANENTAAANAAALQEANATAAKRLLDLKDVSIVFGGLRAVSNLNMHIDEGELVGLIGPNGAGKTTAFNMITGVYEPTEGQVHFDGKLVNGHKSYQVTQMGMARTFQNIRLFSELSVLDNVKIAFNMHVKYNLAEAVVRDKLYFSEEAYVTEKSMELLEIFHLEKHADDIAKNLPYGEQRRLEIARALATQPKLLLLDEPAAGMNPQETKELTHMIQWIRDQFKLSVLLIEHDMSLVMGVCERIYVLEYGFCIAEGKPEEIKNNKRVIEAYLGGEAS
jgi:branched-chain amino acid transport system ATP-binding protein